MKELPRNRPVNPAAEREDQARLKEPDLEKAIDEETGGRIRPDQDDLRTDKHPADKPNKAHHY